MKQNKNALICRLMFLTLLILSAQPRFSDATPSTWGERIVGPLSWPKNSTLNAYIQADPQNLGRDQLAKEGVERWKTVLAARGITLNVNIGNPPQNAVNPITYRWEQENFIFLNSFKLNLGLNDGMGAAATSDGKKITAGAAYLHRGLAAATDADKTYIRNLAEHEMTHILGLADEEKGEVMNHSQPKTARALNELDRKELNTLYGTANTGGNAKPMGKATKTGGGSALGFYEYRFDLIAANALADPNDPEHISFISLDIDPNLVTGMDLPAGWIGLVPQSVPLQNDPFFADYMEDGGGEILPWDTANPMKYIALRSSFAEALTDGLPPDFDPGLTLQNTSLSFKLYTTPDVLDRPIRVWAGDDFQWVIGPSTVPEPMSFVLFGIGMIGLPLLRRTFKK